VAVTLVGMDNLPASTTATTDQARPAVEHSRPAAADRLSGLLTAETTSSELLRSESAHELVEENAAMERLVERLSAQQA